jgi:hypothetical protein
MDITCNGQTLTGCWQMNGEWFALWPPWAPGVIAVRYVPGFAECVDVIDPVDNVALMQQNNISANLSAELYLKNPVQPAYTLGDIASTVTGNKNVLYIVIAVVGFYFLIKGFGRG